MHNKTFSAPVTHAEKRPTTVSKETYYSIKRDLLQYQKRPTTVSPVTHADMSFKPTRSNLSV